MILPADFVPTICHYCGKREATGLRRDRRGGNEVEVCSERPCLEHTEEDAAHPWPQPVAEQPTLF